MYITLCGSASFEDRFKELNKHFTLAGHAVYSLGAFPSEQGGKNWYTEDQKKILDQVHFDKIKNSDVIYVISKNAELGESTSREVIYAAENKKGILSPYPLNFTYKSPTYGLIHVDGKPVEFIRTCPYNGCLDKTQTGPCALCYE